MVRKRSKTVDGQRKRLGAKERAQKKKMEEEEARREESTKVRNLKYLLCFCFAIAMAMARLARSSFSNSFFCVSA